MIFFTILGWLIIINIILVLVLIFRRFFTYILGFALLAFYIFIITQGAR